MNDLINLKALNLKGHCKIELKNEKTGKVETVERDNAIMPAFYGMLERYMYNALTAPLLKYKNSIFATNNTAYRGTYGLQSSSDCFSRLSLTDNSNAITASDDFLPGAEVAYSTFESYAGGSTDKRGNPNYTDTKITKDYLKFAFDFSTNQGNGTFQTIGFTRNYSINSSCFFVETGSNVLAPDYANRKLYYIKNNGLKVLDIGTNAITTVVDNLLLTGYTNVTGLTYNAGKVYVLLKNTSGFASSNSISAIKELDLTTCSYTETIFTTSDSATALYFIKDNEVYFTSSYTSSYPSNYQIVFKKYNLQTKITENVGSSFNVSVSGSEDLKYSNGASYNPANGLIECVNNTKYTFDDFLNKNINKTQNASYVSSSECVSFDNKSYYFHSGYLMEAKEGEMSNIMTAIVLDAPVTKTNEQTMKITYTINYTLPSEVTV